ncbi:TetR/AcrR family transcriptional regulator [Oceanobacillus neutriphilus]|uniref:TetR family transcriptional regulator n=1 Tax=Oceanobacillus neutriphilus TaxID=531815 RepID=A0ABQ2P0J6_9BACI|nr:TetR/AcrR family transcriptional regulator [Oceanobacillus neutriphilus]GGP15268.1 TetR family transcriptional regulator [Oceanobacillus neutriphilus]
MSEDQIRSSVKDQELVMRRRKQIIEGAMRLFKEKGFHRTTTREIAKESGFSIGTLYEYIRTKEDVLFLVCEFVHDQVRDQLSATVSVENPTEESLRQAIRQYLYFMDTIQPEILMLYQETKSLNKEKRKFVLEQERKVVGMMEELLTVSLKEKLSPKEIYFLANNIVVSGHMWCFRRWMIQKEFTIDEYVELQMKQVNCWL